MRRQFDSKGVPLRRPRTGAAGGPSTACCGRKLCGVTIVLVALVIGISLYVDRELVRSFNPKAPPLLRKQIQYVANLASNKNETPDESAADAPDSPSDDVSIDSRPHLYLHVGPQKTGSSTLQYSWDQLGPALLEDNYNYKHVMPEDSDFDCEVGPWGTFINCRASQQLKDLIEKSKEEGKNLLLSDENLDHRFAQPLRDVIDDTEWQVTVIVMYRRIHEWLVSWYNQINKTTNRGVNGTVLFDENGIPYREKHKYWPDQGGIHVPSFSSWYQQYTHYWDTTELVSKHRSIAFYNTYKPLFGNVLVYNIHQEGGLVVNFMCGVIQDSPTACDQVRSPDWKFPKMNPSVNLNHDILAVHAYDQGLVKKSLSRKEVVDAVAQFMTESDKILPLKCDNDTINQIGDWLVDSEMNVLGKSWHPSMEADLRVMYESYVVAGEICDVDFEVLLGDEDWTQFFKSLGAEIQDPIDLPQKSTESIISINYTDNETENIAMTNHESKDSENSTPDDAIDFEVSPGESRSTDNRRNLVLHVGPVRSKNHWHP